MPDWVLMYHAVADGPDDPHRIQVTPERFRRQMAWLHRRGRCGVSLGSLPDRPGAVGLTFDDGYADFAETVVPILVDLGFTATVYVVAGRLGGTNDWDDGPARRLMTVDQVRKVAAAGMEVASHTLTHPRLPDLPDDGLARELRGSRTQLEDVLDAPVTGFAYPYGEFGPREARAVAASGYRYAAAIDPRPHSGPWAVPRTHVGQADTPWRLHATRLRHPPRPGGPRTGGCCTSSRGAARAAPNSSCACCADTTGPTSRWRSPCSTSPAPSPSSSGPRGHRCTPCPWRGTAT